MNKQYYFGQWVYIDGVSVGQFIHDNENGTYTIDINGEWHSFSPERLSPKK